MDIEEFFFSSNAQVAKLFLHLILYLLLISSAETSSLLKHSVSNEFGHCLFSKWKGQIIAIKMPATMSQIPEKRS